MKRDKKLLALIKKEQIIMPESISSRLDTTIS